MMHKIRARVPLRISFAGGGTDVSPYPETKGGCVISTTVSRYAYAILELREDNIKQVISNDYDISLIYNEIQNLPYNGELDLIKAALRLFDLDDYGFNLTIACDAPPGSGLGSSSAVMVAVIGAIAKMTNASFTSYEIAELAYQLERLELGIKGGYQDQYAASFGGFNFIEFNSNSIIVNPLRIKPEILNELHSNLILINTGKTRLSSNILARQISATKNRDEIVLRSLDEIKHLAIEMKNTLLRGTLDDFGDLLHQGWENKKQLDKSISNKYIDHLYDTAQKTGAVGGKISGAGGGGHMILYCDITDRRRLEKKMIELGCQVINYDFEDNGLQSWIVKKNGVSG